MMHTVSVSVYHSHRFHHAESHPGFGIGWKNDGRLTHLDFADDMHLLQRKITYVKK